MPSAQQTLSYTKYNLPSQPKERNWHENTSNILEKSKQKYRSEKQTMQEVQASTSTLSESALVSTMKYVID
jgi:hypothetical protein